MSHTLKHTYGLIKTNMEALGYVYTNVPMVLEESSFPISGDGRFFAIDFQSTNTDQFRDAYRDSKTMQRLENEVTLKLCWRLKPFDNSTTLDTIFDAETAIMNDMTNPAKLPEAAVFYERSDRSISASKEFIFVDMVFRVTIAWDV